MAHSEGGYHVSGLAITLALAVAVIMISTGVIMAFYGGWALLFGGVESDSETIISLSGRTWGAVHFAMGIGIVAAGGALLSAKPWARIVAIAMSTIVLLAGLVTLPDSPVWSLFLIILNAAFLWALIFHSQDMNEVMA